MKTFSSKFIFMHKNRRERCPYCGFLDVVKWGRRNGRQRYRCKKCNGMFTFRREDVSRNNRFVWFRWWVIDGLKIEKISEISGYSVRQLKRWFYEYLSDAPSWTVRRRQSVHLLIDGTWFPNKVCLIVYRDNDAKSTLFYRLTDDEREREIVIDLEAMVHSGIHVSSVTSDGGQDIIRAVRKACPYAVRQRCLAHIERECLTLLTQHPKSSAGMELRRLVLQISGIETHNDERYWKRSIDEWYRRHEDFLNEKSPSALTGEDKYMHDNVRRAYNHIRFAMKDMFHYIDNPKIPKTTNALESFFGHLKDNVGPHRGLSFEHQQGFVKWYLYFRNEVVKRKN